MRDHGDVAVGRDHQAAAGRVHGVDIGGSQHRAAADQRVGRRHRAQRADAVECVRAVQRHLEQPKAGVEKRLADRHRLGRGQAAQDRNQWRARGEQRVDHRSVLQRVSHNAARSVCSAAI